MLTFTLRAIASPEVGCGEGARSRGPGAAASRFFATLNSMTTFAPSAEATASISRCNGKVRLVPSSPAVGKRVKRRSLRIAQKSPSTGRSKRTCRRPSCISLEKATGAGQASTNWARSPWRVASTRTGSPRAMLVVSSTAAVVATSEAVPTGRCVTNAHPPDSRIRPGRRDAPSVDAQLSKSSGNPFR